jgi:hypothetical protein
MLTDIPSANTITTIQILSCRLWLPRPQHPSTIRKSLAIRPNIPIYLSLLLISSTNPAHPARKRCVHLLFPCPRSLADLIAYSILIHVVCRDRMGGLLLLGHCRKSQDRKWTISCCASQNYNSFHTFRPRGLWTLRQAFPHTAF